MTNQTIIAWSEIPVTDMDSAVAFYNTVFGYEMTVDTTAGPIPMAVLGNAMTAGGAHLYPGKPAADGGNTVHITLPDSLEAGADRLRAAGGEVLSQPVEIPAGRFVYAKDPDGNSIGLFEPKAA